MLDPYYGIKFEPSGRSKGGKNKIRISWSPIIAYNSSSKSEFNYTIQKTNIAYKLFFAYSFDVAQVF